MTQKGIIVPQLKRPAGVIIVESKPISKYLRQIEKMGQNINEYKSIWGYSLNETEEWSPIFQYPEYPFKITENYTNLRPSSSEVVEMA